MSNFSELFAKCSDAELQVAQKSLESELAYRSSREGKVQDALKRLKTEQPSTWNFLRQAEERSRGQFRKAVRTSGLGTPCSDVGPKNVIKFLDRIEAITTNRDLMLFELKTVSESILALVVIRCVRHLLAQLLCKGTGEKGILIRLPLDDAEPWMRAVRQLKALKLSDVSELIPEVPEDSQEWLAKVNSYVRSLSETDSFVAVLAKPWLKRESRTICSQTGEVAVPSATKRSLKRTVGFTDLANARQPYLQADGGVKPSAVVLPKRQKISRSSDDEDVYRRAGRSTSLSSTGTAVSGTFVERTEDGLSDDGRSITSVASSTGLTEDLENVDLGPERTGVFQENVDIVNWAEPPPDKVAPLPDFRRKPKGAQKSKSSSDIH